MKPICIHQCIKFIDTLYFVAMVSLSGHLQLKFSLNLLINQSYRPFQRIKLTIDTVMKPVDRILQH